MRCFMLALAVAAGALASLAGRAQAENIALLVQAADYKDSEAPRFLLKADRQDDCRLMGEALSARGFKLVQLQETEATQQGVKAELDHIAQTAGPADCVVFYFSGHGARQSGQFSICPWDANARTPDKDITEGDLRDWLGTLKTRNVTIILDCCFSGRPARGAKSVTRPKFMGRDSDDVVGSDPDIKLPPDRAVLLTGCSQNEIAIEFSLGQDKGQNTWAGLFTYWLARELKNANPETTYRQLMGSVREDMQRWLSKQGGGAGMPSRYTQTPVLHGDAALISRRLFSPVPDSPQSPPTVPPYATITAASDGQVTLDRGSEAGVTVGSHYALYPPGETEFATGGETAKMEIVSVPDKANTATGKLLEGGQAAQVAKDYRALEIQHKVELPRGDVLVKVDAPASAAGVLLQKMRVIPGVRVVEQGDAHLILKAVDSGGQLVGSLLGADGTTPIEPAQVYEKIEGCTPAQLAQYVRPAVEMQALLHPLTDLRNPAPRFKAEVAVGKPAYVEGEAMTFYLKADRPCHGLLVYLDANGCATLLYPRQGATKDEIPAGDRVEIPGPLTPGRKLECCAPFGRESVIFIALQDEARAAALTTKLEHLLRSVADPGTAFRGKGVREELQQVQLGDLSTWAVATCQVQTLSRETAGK